MQSKFIDISDWQRLEHINTGGTRDKFIAISPEGEKYYFKTSIKRFPSEFWSEVIAYQVGKTLGFDICEYNIAFNGENLGCISKAINNPDQSLEPGYNYIIDFYPDFQDKVIYKNNHNYQFIIKALDHQFLSHEKAKVIEMIIFDAIIGNGDRHSENWSLLVDNNIKLFADTIRKYRLLITKTDEALEKAEKTQSEYTPYNFLDPISMFKNWRKKIERKQSIANLKKDRERTDSMILEKIKPHIKFSCIYDSGSSLCRGELETKLQSLLSDDVYFSRYLDKGYPDIKWNGQKVNHFDLVQLLIEAETDIASSILRRIKELYNKDIIENIVRDVDVIIPKEHQSFKLTNLRKQVIIKYLCSRIEILLDKIE